MAAFAGWLARNQQALEPVVGLMLPENRALLQGFGQVILASAQGLAGHAGDGVYRQTRMGTAAVLAPRWPGGLRKGT